MEAPGETGAKEREGDMGLELTEATVYLQYRLEHTDLTTESHLEPY